MTISKYEKDIMQPKLNSFLFSESHFHSLKRGKHIHLTLEEIINLKELFYMVYPSQHKCMKPRTCR